MRLLLEYLILKLWDLGLGITAVIHEKRQSQDRFNPGMRNWRDWQLLSFRMKLSLKPDQAIKSLFLFKSLWEALFIIYNWKRANTVLFLWIVNSWRWEWYYMPNDTYKGFSTKCKLNGRLVCFCKCFQLTCLLLKLKNSAGFQAEWPPFVLGIILFLWLILTCISHM